MEKQDNKGFYKLSWLQRVGFGSGDLAQNLIFQVTCTYLTFFFTDIYGLEAAAVALMFTVGNILNVIWDPIVGTIIDKSNPKFGKYRSYLLYVGVPLSISTTGTRRYCCQLVFSKLKETSRQLANSLTIRTLST